MKFSVFVKKATRKMDQYKRKCSFLINILFLRVNDVKTDNTVMVAGKLFIRNEGCISIGHNVRINSADWANPIGGMDKTYLQIMGGGTDHR